jgi:hypothetical protein
MADKELALRISVEASPEAAARIRQALEADAFADFGVVEASIVTRTSQEENGKSWREEERERLTIPVLDQGRRS